jgi:F-type H+-transporting ATPase subunit gamma
MASMLDIKRRIKSVNSTKQITKAMNLVASSKLTKARSNFNDTKPFFDGTVSVISNIIKRTGQASNPFLKKREGNKVAVIVITGDRGLCGGYNANACKAALNVIGDREAEIITIGSKAREFFKHKKADIAAGFRDISEKPTYQDAKQVADTAVKMFSEGKVDEVYIVYTKYISTISNEPQTLKLLPLNPDNFMAEEATGPSTLTIYEPDEEAVLDYIIPKYINTVVYGALVESAVCELSSRMTAMDAATDNASDMIDRLNLFYNRARQGAITQEITEIVSGSNALD